MDMMRAVDVKERRRLGKGRAVLGLTRRRSDDEKEAIEVGVQKQAVWTLARRRWCSDNGSCVGSLGRTDLNDLTE